MKKSLKALGAVGVAALTVVAGTSCTKNQQTSNKVESPIESKVETGAGKETKTQTETKKDTETKGSETKGSTTKKDQVKTLDIDVTGAKTTYIFGDGFDDKGLVVKAGEKVLNEGDYTVVGDSIDFNKEGEYEVFVTAVVDGQKYKGSYKITVMEAIWEDISTVEEFLAIRKTDSESGIVRTSYRLTADIDLAGITLDESNVVFEGTFNGNGHTIKNATYQASTSKNALMFKQLGGKAVVKNVRFFNCSATSVNETVAIVAGEICEENSKILVENVEFSMCTVYTSGNYAGMIVGRNETGKMDCTFNKITVKNFSSVKCTSYGAGLIGDVIAGSKMTITNSDVDMDTYTSQNGAYLTGRNRGGVIYDIENIIIRGNCGGKNGSTAFIVGANKEATGTIKNIVVIGTTDNTADIFIAASKNISYENVYYISGTANDKATKIDLSTFTYDWAINTVGLDPEIFVKDDVKQIVVKGSSSNVPGADAKIKGLSLSTSTVAKQFFKKDKFSTEGLGGSIVWDDGCVTAAADLTTVVKNAKGEVVDFADLNNVEVGHYVVEVTASVKDKGEAQSSYEIDVVEYVSTKVVTDDAKLVYTVGQKFDTKDLYVFANLSDNTRSLVKNPTVVITDSENNVIKDAFAKEGKYKVTISANGLEDSYEIIVVKAQENVGVVTVNVSNEFTDGSLDENNCYKFSTIEKALNYLDSLKLDANAQKVINVADGTYKEKITVNVPNVSIVGQSQEKTIITWDAAEGTLKLDDSQAYKMECATLIVAKSATGFTLSNITVRNDFDYQNSDLADKQAFALQCNADMSTFNNVYFYGVQDTLYANDGRQYYYNCRIDGAVDYVFGEKDVVALFDGCVFHSVTRYEVKDSKKVPAANNGYVFAPKSDANPSTGFKYNYVIVNSTFEADDEVVDGSMSVARPWGKGGVAILNSTFSKAYSKNAYGAKGDDGKALKPRYDAMSGTSPEAAFFFEYNNKGEGSIDAAVTGVKFLSDTEAANYVAKNIFAKENGSKKFETVWNPVGENEIDPSKVAEQSVAVYYTLAKDNYKVGDTYADSTFIVYLVTGESTTGKFEITKIDEAKEVIKNAEGTVVTAEDALKTAGKYTTELVYNEKVLATAEFNVNSSDVSEHTDIITADASVEANPDLAKGIDEDKAIFKQGDLELQFYTKANGDVRNPEKTATSKVGDYNNAYQLSGGKSAISATKVDNAVKITVGHKGKIKVVVGAKKASAEEVIPTLWDSNCEIVKSYSDALPAFGTDVAEFEFEVEAGSYYFGTQKNGCFLYAVQFVYTA